MAVLGMAAILLVLSRADFSSKPVPAVVAEDKPALPPRREVVPVAAVEPRRVPLAGVEGFHVIFMPDGTSLLEGPDGKKQPLVDAAFAAKPSPAELSARLAEKLKPRSLPRKSGPGQLVVLDDGVVDVPVGAQITLIEKDRLVVLNGDGTSTVHYADGRTEIRDRRRPERRGK